MKKGDSTQELEQDYALPDRTEPRRTNNNNTTKNRSDSTLYVAEEQYAVPDRTEPRQNSVTNLKSGEFCEPEKDVTNDNISVNNNNNNIVEIKSLENETFENNKNLSLIHI